MSHDPVINDTLIPPANSECGVFDPVALFAEDCNASHGIPSVDGVVISNRRLPFVGNNLSTHKRNAMACVVVFRK